MSTRDVDAVMPWVVGLLFALGAAWATWDDFHRPPPAPHGDAVEKPRAMVEVWHDDQRGVTCWLRGAQGISCLSDNDLWRPR